MTESISHVIGKFKRNLEEWAHASRNQKERLKKDIEAQGNRLVDYGESQDIAVDSIRACIAEWSTRKLLSASREVKQIRSFLDCHPAAHVHAKIAICIYNAANLFTFAAGEMHANADDQFIIDWAKEDYDSLCDRWGELRRDAKSEEWKHLAAWRFLTEFDATVSRVKHEGDSWALLWGRLQTVLVAMQRPMVDRLIADADRKLWTLRGELERLPDVSDEIAARMIELANEPDDVASLRNAQIGMSRHRHISIGLGVNSLTEPPED